jgi:hypothetical protein
MTLRDGSATSCAGRVFLSANIGSEGSAWSRRSFLAGLGGVTLASPARAQSAMRSGGPPVLRTMHSQFVERRPLNEVPALTIERIDHKMIALNAFRGRAVLVNF